jgi:uncharacterized membrane protein (DUF485 family)
MLPCRHCGRIANNRDKVCPHCGKSLESPVMAVPGSGAAELKNDPLSISQQAIKETLPAFDDIPSLFLLLLYPITWVLILAVFLVGWLGNLIAGNIGMVGGVIGLMVAVIVVKSIQEHRKPKPDQSTKSGSSADKVFARKFRA